MSKQYQQQSIRLQLKCMSKEISPTVVKQTMEFIDQEIQKAFQRGMVAGRVYGVGLTAREKHQMETDDVFIAQRAGINMSDALSNLYSKEKGFKQ